MSKITIIGSGNIGLSLAKGLVKSGQYISEDITLTRRSLVNLQEEAALGFQVSDDNTQAVMEAELVVLAILPQQLRRFLEYNKHTGHTQQILVSVISGVNCADIKQVLGDDIVVVRAMPNTAIAIGQSMTSIAAVNASDTVADRVQRLFDSVGSVVVIQEDLM